MLESLWMVLGKITYALIDLTWLELVLSLIFTINGGRIKFTLDFGMSKFRTTTLYVSIFLIIGVLSFLIMNTLQDKIILLLSSIGWRLIPTFIMLLGFDIFWVTKVVLGRNWDFKLVITSIIIFFIGFITLSLSYIT